MIRIGTAGYSYADWVGPFYPPGTRGKDMLAHYAQEFAFVELNFSYYRMPDAKPGPGGAQWPDDAGIIKLLQRRNIFPAC